MYFLDTTETIPEGVGFSSFDITHICWLLFFAVSVIGNCIWYHKMGAVGRDRWRKLIAVSLGVNELFKMAILTIGGNYTWSYLPLHLCSINIFLILIHAWKPSRVLSNFLYTVCIPGALAALLFPSWSVLPISSGMHIHSFTVHITLALYPIVLTVNGDLKPAAKDLWKSLLLLLAMAVPIYFLNLLLDTNYMFLMYAEPDNPLYIFEQLWGNHIFGFPILIAAIVLVMYLPLELYRHFKKK